MTKDFPEYACTECGRKFRLTTQYWQYYYPRGGAKRNYFCRWTCYRKYTDRIRTKIKVK